MGRDTRGRDYGASGATHGETDALLHHAPDVGGEPFAPLELRKPQDRAWGWAFALLYAANLVAGVLTFLNRWVHGRRFWPWQGCQRISQFPDRSMLHAR